MQREFINASSRIFRTVIMVDSTDAGQVCTAAGWRSFLKEKQRTGAEEFSNITAIISVKSQTCVTTGFIMIFVFSDSIKAFSARLLPFPSWCQTAGGFMTDDRGVGSFLSSVFPRSVSPSTDTPHLCAISGYLSYSRAEEKATHS